MQNTEVVLKELVALIRHEREARGLNYEDFSATSGLHRTTLGLYDRGERSPSLEAALNMAVALDIPLSDLLRKAESAAKGNFVSEHFLSRREVPLANFRNPDRLRKFIGLPVDALRSAILSCYQTLDTIDEQLNYHGTDPISQLVELANLSSMIGNLLGAGIAHASNGLYVRNKPHAYPDLLPQDHNHKDLEIKVALEKNKPKGHLPKAGNYITFRYVLCNKDGVYLKGKDNRGSKVFIWEVKVGELSVNDFDISNTDGDSGKTAVIKTNIFNSMDLVYYDPELLPYSSKSLKYPGFN
ncbi:MAG: helix-turn-helix transcriptional regulator [Verrucomicrobia bacterium]|nr:helix-turn-helix transcriptional regulator [Verrucomicrobiota bacterium]MCH8514121.1 helix-turn-helix transcriptional regulator [Kiritimatiellia bacterium]